MARSRPDRRYERPRLLRAATLLAVAAIGSGAPACSPSSLLRIDFGDTAPDGGFATLKIRLRALEPDDIGLRVVANQLPSRAIEPVELQDELLVAIEAEPGSPLARARVLVEILLYEDSPEVVDAAFVSLDDPVLRGMDCVIASGETIPCSHAPLSALSPRGAASLVLDDLGRTNADVLLFPLGAAPGAVDDADLDTFPNACPEAPLTCAAEAQDCEPSLINANPFEVEEAFFGLCLDGVDQDCSGQDGPCIDLDMDGYLPPEDCNDNAPGVNPGAIEDGETNCGDGIDQNCDGADAPCSCDIDGDLFCPMPEGSLPGGDCCEDGTEASLGCNPALALLINPGRPEICGNSVDDDCDGADSSCGSADADGDGFCAEPYGCDPTEPPCAQLIAQVDLSPCGGMYLDCRDWDAGVSPDAMEDCGGVDRDCDGMDPPCTDMDMDGWDMSLDCNDMSAEESPGNVEICGNTFDDDCTGGDTPCDGDMDGDSYLPCPVGQTTGCDCDDSDSMLGPGATEACNGIDDDCDGIIDDGNPGYINPVSGATMPCFGNPVSLMPPPYMDVANGICRIGVIACSVGAPVCILFAPPLSAEACNGWNDLCLALGTTPNLPMIEWDLDGDTYRRGCGMASDCCDGPGDPACASSTAEAMAATVYPGAPETCTSPGVDNDCDGTVAESECPADETCDTVSLQCECGAISPPTGPACPGGSPNPVCDGTACECDMNSTCDSDETCNVAMGRCECASDGAGGGPACPSSGPNPTCLASGCACDTDSDCDADETCVAGECTCGTTSPAAGPACLDTSTTAPDCSSGTCRCGTATCGPMETCTAAGGDCNCAGTTAPTGQACPAGAAPDCFAAVGCRCGDATSICGPGETCPSGDCNCEGTSAPTGEACVGTTPTCVAGAGCRCGDATSICGPGETCNASTDCACAATTASTGEACPNSGAAPDCVVGTGCRCEASICGLGETCTGVGGNCACGATTAPTGEACAAGPNPNCVGAACACDADSTCDSDETCLGATCACGATVPAMGPACPNASPNPSCIAGACACDADSICGLGETCAGGASCQCGITTVPAGPACISPMVCVGGVCG